MSQIRLHSSLVTDGIYKAFLESNLINSSPGTISFAYYNSIAYIFMSINSLSSSCFLRASLSMKYYLPWLQSFQLMCIQWNYLVCREFRFLVAFSLYWIVKTRASGPWDGEKFSIFIDNLFRFDFSIVVYQIKLKKSLFSTYCALRNLLVFSTNHRSSLFISSSRFVHKTFFEMFLVERFHGFALRLT